MSKQIDIEPSPLGASGWSFFTRSFCFGCVFAPKRNIQNEMHFRFSVNKYHQIYINFYINNSTFTFAIEDVDILNGREKNVVNDGEQKRRWKKKYADGQMSIDLRC